MTILFVGDIHLKSARVLPAVDRAVAMTGADGVVFLGDVCDDWDATAREAVTAVRMFADWVAAPVDWQRCVGQVLRGRVPVR